ncbi:uncharacterized protein LOC135710062 [Ochlerotatus camptorhynchus]|uniref:uncharacterized protein LOC135710062 n=1 Tax=Ochlerotatus camptorhynchus TaxID=644619 RepID=UPI0031D3E840
MGDIENTIGIESDHQQNGETTHFTETQCSSTIPSPLVANLKLESTNATKPDEDEDFMMQFSVEFLKYNPEDPLEDIPEDIIEYCPEDNSDGISEDRPSYSYEHIDKDPANDITADNDALAQEFLDSNPEDNPLDEDILEYSPEDKYDDISEDRPSYSSDNSAKNISEVTDPLTQDNSKRLGLGTSLKSRVDERPGDRRPLLDISNEINHRSLLHRQRGIRYTATELDSAAYDLITGGNTNYLFRQANMKLPSLKTVKRHIVNHTSETQEATIMVQSLLRYLNAHQYPLIVALSEDGTAVSPNIEYDPRSDSLRGLVAPFDVHGMPSKDVLKATTLIKMVNDMQTYHVGEYLYVIMALPMAVGASPICIFYMCSDNRFTYTDVISRWTFVEAELQKVGISVVSISSDGDTRLLKAMKERSGIPSPFASKVYEPHFAADLTGEPVNSSYRSPL